VAIVNDALSACPLHKREGFGKKYLALKPGKAGIVLDVYFSTVSKNQGCTLGLYFAAAKFEIMRRSVMLHLFTGLKDIFACPFFAFSATKLILSYEPGQGLVWNYNALATFQFLLNSHRVSSALAK
jgi:hypothetical protein